MENTYDINQSSIEDYENSLDELFDLDFDEIKNENYEHELDVMHHNIQERNSQITGLLSVYARNRQEQVDVNRNYKKRLFWLVFIISLFLAASIVVSICCLIFLDTLVIEQIVGIITAIVGALVSIFGIIKIITKYLFPIKEEENMIELIKTIINNDLDLAKFIERHKNKDSLN